MTDESPSDLIPIADAEKMVGHSRQWMKNHVTIYRIGTRDYVSQSAAQDAKKEYDTPRVKDGKENGDKD